MLRKKLLEGLESEMGEDGFHPNDKGCQVMAERLRSLGYEPLYPR